MWLLIGQIIRPVPLNTIVLAFRDCEEAQQSRYSAIEVFCVYNYKNYNC